MANDEFLHGLVPPACYHGGLRQLLAEMANAGTAVNRLITQARVEALKLTKALDSPRIERLYQLVIDTVTARLDVLQHEGAACPDQLLSSIDAKRRPSPVFRGLGAFYPSTTPHLVSDSL